MGRAARRGRYRWSRTSDRSHRPEVASSRRRRDGWQYKRGSARQRPRSAARVLRSAKGDRVKELTSKTIAELRDGFRSGEFTAREIADAFNAAVAAARTLNAFTVETPGD